MKQSDKDETVIKGPLTEILYEKIYYDDGGSKDLLEFRDSFGSTFILEKDEIEEFVSNFKAFMKVYGGEHAFDEESKSQ